MIVGLSNPKMQYHQTRHNAGSWCIYDLMKLHSKVLVEEKKFFGFTGLININARVIRMLVPNIFMNLNGKSVFKMASFYNIHLSEILIIHDDLELCPGIVKLKYSYGHNGHNGLRNIISCFQKKIDFYRFRIGIGRPEKKNLVSSFVLSRPTKTENMLIKKSILHTIKAIGLFIG